MQEEIIREILETLEKTTNIKCAWQASDLQTPSSFHGKIQMHFENHYIELPVQVKKEIRGSHYAGLVQNIQKLGNFMLIALYIPPKVRKILKDNEISYLDQAGNLYVKTENCMIWIEAHKRPLKVWQTIHNSFTKTGLKVVFQFLLDPSLVNATYRQISQRAGVGLGSINHILTGLQQLGYLNRAEGDAFILSEKSKLLARWLEGFESVLKPSLHLGNFRLASEIDLEAWNDFALEPHLTQWSGDVGAALLLGEQKIQSWILYTSYKKAEFAKKYALIQDQEGPIRVHRKFWKHPPSESVVIPYLLVYADLIGQEDAESSKMAEMIWQKYLQK